MSQPVCFLKLHRLPLPLRVSWALLLVLLTWQGPIPWIDCHCFRPAAGVLPHDNDSLASHLCHYHAVAFFAGLEITGWHVHMAIPDSANEDSQEPVRPGSRRILMETSNAGLDRAIGNAVQAIPGSHELAACARPISLSKSGCHEGRAWLGRSFFETFAPTLALPLRLGVLRT